MNSASLHAKLRVVRALSTALLLLAASTASAQFPRGPVRWDPPAWWITADYGTTRAATLSDKGSASTWLLDKATRWRAGIAHGTRDRALGLSYSQADVPLSITRNLACLGCTATVTSQTMLATYHVGSPLGTSKLTTMTELGIGAVRWSRLRGRDGNGAPPSPAATDFAYGITIGLGLPLGSQVESFVAYDVLQVRHRTMTTAGQPSSMSSVGFATLRYGVRIRLGLAE